MSRKGRPSAAPEKKVPPFNPSQADDLWVKNPAVIKTFLDTRPEFEQLCTEVEYILKKKVMATSIETSFLGSRAKTLNSFLEKLKRKKYTDPFNQLDDLAGVRVVCLYSSDISKIIKIIRAEFEIVQEVDKREELDTNKFGYIGHHFIVQLGKNYSGARYDDLRLLRCEIQVRTVVQDAWAIIQHHMVYKKESQVPSNLIRKLNGLAGLFETVDDQFEFIRMQRDIYLDTVRESKSAPDDFLENELNYDSFIEFLQWRYRESLNDESTKAAAEVLDVLNELNFLKLKDIEIFMQTKEKFVEEAIQKYQQTCADAGANSRDDIPGPLKVAVALSSDPEWRTKFPWGSFWLDSFTHAGSDV